MTPDAHCPNGGEYMPMALDGSKRVHDCDRTPPHDGLKPTIYACPICGGHGAYRWGCWGTREHPHPHAYMRPVHELVRERHIAREALAFYENEANWRPGSERSRLLFGDETCMRSDRGMHARRALARMAAQ